MLPAGPWTATITVRSGELERTVEAVITFPAASATEAAPAAATEVEGRQLLVPLALGLLLLVGVMVLLVWRRGRRDEEEAQESSLSGGDPPSARTSQTSSHPEVTRSGTPRVRQVTFSA